MISGQADITKEKKKGQVGMAGYVPESTKEVQALIVKSYADTVLNAFLTAPELVAVAPVGSRRITRRSCPCSPNRKRRRDRKGGTSCLCAKPP